MDEEGCRIELIVFNVNVEETVAEEGLLELAGEGFEKVFRVWSCEECLTEG